MAGAPHLEAFLDAARYFVGVEEENGNNVFPPGSRGNEIFQLYGGGWGSPWCAIFVSACAIKAEIDNVVIALSEYAIGVQSNTVDWYDGVWIDGPLINGGHAVTPIPGDLITFGDAYYQGHEHACHIGIVEYVQGDEVHTIEGNSGDACRRNVYSLDYSAINAYVRPDWSKVGDDISAYLASAGLANVGPLYQNRNDRHDMTIREVGYLSNAYKLSNKSSGVSISVINYTSLLGDLYEMFAPAVSTQVVVDTSKLTGNIKISVDYLLAMGFNAAAASAITGCLKTYSNVLPTYGRQLANGIWLQGIGAWDDISLLKDKLGYGWNTNLSGQLEYLTDDLQLNFKDLVALIKSVLINADSAERAANMFMTKYNKHYITTDYINDAKANSRKIYEDLIITRTQVVGGLSNLIDINGNPLSAQECIDIPGSVPQTGIIDDFTSYSAWFLRWNSASPQHKLALIWEEQGFPNDKGIATIGGYYCVAVRPKFGTCGDVIVVTLEDGTSFPAIVCDEKGDDAGSEWGHVKENGNISIIEWERVKTEDGEVLLEDVGFADVDSIGYWDWYGQDVLKITNYGKYVYVSWG